MVSIWNCFPVDSSRFGRPSFVNMNFLQTALRENPKKTSRECAKQFNTFYTSIRKYIYEFGRVHERLLGIITNGVENCVLCSHINNG